MSLYAKLWTDILGDEKLMRAARKGAKELALLPWLFAWAKKVDDEGRLTVDGEPIEPADLVAVIPGVTVARVARCLEELVSIGVLIKERNGVLCLAAWEKRATGRMKEPPEVVAERVREHRQRKRNARKRDETIDETHSETEHSNADVTVDVTQTETVDVTTGNASRSREEDEELEKELELESSTTPPNATLRDSLASAAHRAAFDRIAAAVSSPETWEAEMRARLDGMHGPRLTRQQLGDSLSDYVANGNLKSPNFKHFRGYLNNAATAPKARANSSRFPARNGAKNATPQQFDYPNATDAEDKVKWQS